MVLTLAPKGKLRRDKHQTSKSIYINKSKTVKVKESTTTQRDTQISLNRTRQSETHPVLCYVQVIVILVVPRPVFLLGQLPKQVAGHPPHTTPFGVSF